jgi:hypothetical protein
MRLPKLGLYIALLSALALFPAYGQQGWGGHSGGGISGGHAWGGGYRGGGGYYGGRGYYRGGRGWGGRYWGPGFYFGLGGWGYPYYWGYPSYGAYPYYGYDPYYYSYDPYMYGGSYSYRDTPQYQGQDDPAPQQQTRSSGGSNQGYYLIAFNDHTIQAATAYKVEDNQIHWITREGQEMQAPLSSVDIPFSQQINRDRNVEFPIP